MNSYELSRNWFDFAFENPSKITPAHGILYFFCIEHCNRLGWKKEFGLPTTMAKEAIGIRSYNTYINVLNDLIEWGFIELIEKSKNQYSSNIIALSKFNKALDKALDKALIKHDTKQGESTIQSISSINKQETINKETINNKPILDFSFVNEKLIDDFKAFVEYRKSIKKPIKTQDQLQRIYNQLKKYSKVDAVVAKEIINRSIVNGWQGLFELPQVKPTEQPKTLSRYSMNKTEE